MAVLSAGDRGSSVATRAPSRRAWGHQMPDLIVLAIGGNSLIRDEAHRTVPDQWVLARETCHHIAQIVEAGPPGRRHARQRAAGRLHPAAIGAGAPRAARGAARLVRRRHAGRDRLHDPAGAGERVPAARHAEAWPSRSSRRSRSIRTARRSGSPSKPIGSFMDEATAQARAAQEGWAIAEDAGRGWRRVVPSPEPLAIVELEADPRARATRDSS